MSTLQATQGGVWRPSAVTHAFPLAAFQGLFLFRQHRNRPAKGLSHTLIPSESVCVGRPPVWVKTKINGNLAKAAPQHARLQGLPVRRVWCAQGFPPPPAVTQRGVTEGPVEACAAAPCVALGGPATCWRSAHPGPCWTYSVTLRSQGTDEAKPPRVPAICPRLPRGTRAGTMVTGAGEPAARAPHGVTPHQVLSRLRPRCSLVLGGIPAPGGPGLLRSRLLISMGTALRL